MNNGDWVSDWETSLSPNRMHVFSIYFTGTLSSYNYSTPCFGGVFLLFITSMLHTLLPDVQLLPLACPSEFHLLHHLCKNRNFFRNHSQTSSPLTLFTPYTISSMLRRQSKLYLLLKFSLWASDIYTTDYQTVAFTVSKAPRSQCA